MFHRKTENLGPRSPKGANRRFTRISPPIAVAEGWCEKSGTRPIRVPARVDLRLVPTLKLNSRSFVSVAGSHRLKLNAALTALRR